MIRNILILFISPLITITTFAREPLFPNELYITRHPNKIIITDVNNDNLPDAVYSILYSSNQHVEAIINDGKGGVKEIRNLDGSGYWLQQLQTKPEPPIPPNIRQDAKSNTFGYVLEYGEVENGEFNSKGNIYGPEFLKIIPVDWTQDGIDDLLVYVDVFTFGFIIIPGKPDGTFDLGLIEQDTPPPLPPNRNWNQQNYEKPAGVETFGDINGDGITDKVEQTFMGSIPRSDPEETVINIYLGLEDGEYTFFNSFFGHFFDAVILSDFNRDGLLDLLRVPAEQSNQSRMHIGNGDGTFQQPFIVNLGFPGGALFIGDFNGDLIEDILVWQSGTDYIVPDAFFISIGNGDGTFRPFRSFCFLSPKPFWKLHGNKPITIVDANGDGKDDLWVKTFEGDEFQVRGVWLNQHQGTSNINTYELYE